MAETRRRVASADSAPTVADFKQEVVQLGIELTRKVREGNEPKRFETLAAIRDLLEVLK